MQSSLRNMFAILFLSLKVAEGYADARLRASSSSLTTRGKPEGAGQPEPTKELACQECKKHEPYLKECVCMVQDINNAFANDATKELTTRDKYGTKTVNTGAKSLEPAFMWHCRPITKTAYTEEC